MSCARAVPISAPASASAGYTARAQRPRASGPACLSRRESPGGRQPDEIDFKLEIEIEDDERELEIELKR